MAAPGIIILDSSPLGLITHRRQFPPADECRSWMANHIVAGRRFVVPEIVDYELRRELLRLGHGISIGLLDTFITAKLDRYLSLNTVVLRLAADLWAQARRRGAPTADPHALDIDAILAAQALSAGYDPNDFVIATSNMKHLSQFVPAQLWSTI